MYNNQSKHDPVDIRTEYTALSSFYNLVVNHRFMLLGFFITAMSFIISGGITFEKACLLFIFTIGMYIIELRNRVLYNETSYRGMQIERESWGYSGIESYKPFFSSLIKKQLYPFDIIPDQRQNTYVLTDELEIKIRPSHTIGLDIIYWSSILFSIIKIIQTLPPCVNSIIRCLITTIFNQ